MLCGFALVCQCFDIDFTSLHAPVTTSDGGLREMVGDTNELILRNPVPSDISQICRAS